MRDWTALCSDFAKSYAGHVAGQAGVFFFFTAKAAETAEIFLTLIARRLTLFFSYRGHPSSPKRLRRAGRDLASFVFSAKAMLQALFVRLPTAIAHKG
jgi:hypothetical protein